MQSAGWSVSGRGRSSPRRFWERLQDTKGRSDFEVCWIPVFRPSVSGTHSPPAPASALLTSCGCSFCRRGLMACSTPAGARPYTDSEPPVEVCAEQKSRCSWRRPSSSASLPGSYSGPALQRTANPGDADPHSRLKAPDLEGGVGLSLLHICIIRSLLIDVIVSARVLTDCHERAGELVLLFGRRQFVFERKLL